jgi:hypothetical protein
MVASFKCKIDNSRLLALITSCEIVQNGCALQFAKEQTPEICLAAIKHANSLKCVLEINRLIKEFDYR